MKEQTYTQKLGSFQSNLVFIFLFQIEKNAKVLVHLLLRDPVLLVLLCDAVARGIIQPLTGLDHTEPGLPADEGKKRAKKETSQMPRVPSSLEPAAGQRVLKALKVCQSQENCLYIMFTH